MMGFEPLVNQRLLPPTFPRYAKIIKREEMVNYFSRLIDRIKTVCEVVTLPNLHCILTQKIGFGSMLSTACRYAHAHCVYLTQADIV